MKKINILMGIFLMMNMLMLTKAQSPGGIAPQLWYKADAGITQSAGTVTQWNNSASALYNLAQQGAADTTPAYNTSQINFNPSIRFDGTNDRLSAATVPQTETTAATGPFPTSQYIVYRRLSGTNTLYSHSNGGGGTWNVGANMNGLMLITNRGMNTSTPALNEVRLQEIDGNSNAATAYVNGASISTSLNSGAGTSGTQNFWVGAQGTSSFANADIAEVVIYNTAQSGRQQIESYLSLKYGITKSGNYIASNGTTNYWDATANTGYNNNIAAIGRDDNSALYQKQSMSINPGQQLLMGLTGMANTNTANTGTLTDQQFLVVGDNGLEKLPSVAISGIPGVNSRFTSVWKVQNTGLVGTVRIMWPQGLSNLKLVQNASDPTFASGNTVTDMSAHTQTINGVVYNYADVSLSNGQFFTLAAFVQAPGGVVSGLRFWLKSDLGVTTSGTSVTDWSNQSVIGLSVTQASPTKQPVFVSNYMNFNPGINFANNQEMSLVNANPTIFGITNPVTAFYLGNSTSVSGSRTILEMHTGSGDIPTFEWRGNLFGMDLDGTSFQDNGYHATKTVAANTPYIISSGFNNLNAASGGQIFNMFNGAFQNIKTGNTNIPTIGTNIYIGGSGGQEYFQGNLPEIIGYNTYTNNATDIQKINSYLAVKYGMTLDQTTPLDYLNSAGTVIWNGTLNAAFNSNIAGIERDDDSALNQKQSMSMNSGSQVVIGIAGAVANTNALNTNSFTADQKSVMWGDNGLPKIPTAAISGITGVNYRFASVWKVQNTGSVGTVRIMWPQGLSNLKLVQNASDPTFTTGNVPTDMSANTQTINGVVYNYADVTLANGQYFTFAAQVYAPGGVVAALWYRADRSVTPAAGSVTSWKDYSYSMTNVIPGLSSSTSSPTSVNGIGLNLNFNPGITFAQPNALGNSSNLGALTGLNYTIYTSSSAVSTGTRIFGMNMSALTGGLKYDSPGLEPSNIILRNSAGSQILLSTVNPTYTSIVNTSILRASFTGTSVARAKDGDVTGTPITFSNASIPDGGIIFGRNNNDGGDDNGFIGTLSETIVFDGTLSANQINRIDSYLAIKGGITLNTTNTPDYLNSASLAIWTGANNTGYQNNIAGIGRDDLSDLNQKQSQSINTGSQVLIGIGGALANTNALNANSFAANEQFVIWGDNGLARSPVVAIPGVSGANYRFAAIWKAQNTGSTGTVRVMWPQSLNSLKLIQNASDPTFTTGNISTDMSANTETVNGIVYNYADVTLANGQYFTFATQVYAPGGVLAALWYRADRNITPATGSVTSWKDYSYSGINITPALSGPTSAPSAINGIGVNLNFNPGVTFTQPNAIGNGANLNAVTGLNYTIYTSTTQIVNTTSRIFSLNAAGLGGAAKYDVPGIEPASVFLRNASGTQILSTNFNPPYTLNPSVTRTTFTSTNATRAQDGSAVGTTGTFSGASVPNGGVLIGRNANDGGDDNGFTGIVSETIVFDGALSADQINRIDSYLAIKGGITLNAANTPNYLNSASLAIWTGATNTGYQSNIAGIGRDDLSDLNQKQSQSINTGSQILIGITGALADTNALNANSFTANEQFVMWGDNGLAKVPSVAISGIAGINYRFASIWKAQNTGSVGTVRVMWPRGLNNLKLVQNNSDPTFATGNIITDMLTNTQTVNGVVYNYADVTLADGQYFTLVAYVEAPGGVINNLQVWNRADFGTNTTVEGATVTSWNNSAVPGGQLQALSGFSGHTASPVYMNLGSNFNPTVRMIQGAGLGMLNAFSTSATTSGTGGTFYNVSKAGAGGTPTNAYNVQMNVSAATLSATGSSNGEMGPYINNANSAGMFVFPANVTTTNFLNPSTNNILGWSYTTGTAAPYPYKVNGRNNAPSGSYTPSTFTGRNFHLNTDTDGGGDKGGFDYQEVIGYERQITTAEQNKIETYLAIKYGVTLGTFASPVNYTSTNDTTVWSTAASSYNTNVIGIARDDIEVLHQRISKSQDAVADIITISTNGDFTTANNSTNHTDIANDRFYFITGNNGALATYNAQNIMNRRWKVQSTGTAQNLFFKTSDTQANYLIYADDAGMTTNVVSIPLVSGATAGIQIPDGKFFTFAKFTYCTKDPNLSPADTITKIGITIQTKQNGWPENLPNGAVALESKTQGFVITRSQSSAIVNPVEGMLMYDTVDKCMKLYNGTSWHCVIRSCNE